MTENVASPHYYQLKKSYFVEDDLDDRFTMANHGTLPGKHITFTELMENAKSVGEDDSQERIKAMATVQRKIKKCKLQAQIHMDAIVDCRPKQYKYGHRFCSASVLMNISSVIRALVYENRRRVIDGRTSAVNPTKHHYTVIRLDPVMNSALNAVLVWAHGGLLKVYKTMFKEIAKLAFHLRINRIIDELPDIANSVGITYVKTGAEDPLDEDGLTIVREEGLERELRNVTRPTLQEDPQTFIAFRYNVFRPDGNVKAELKIQQEHAVKVLQNSTKPDTPSTEVIEIPDDNSYSRKIGPEPNPSDKTAKIGSLLKFKPRANEKGGSPPRKSARKDSKTVPPKRSKALMPTPRSRLAPHRLPPPSPEMFGAGRRPPAHFGPGFMPRAPPPASIENMCGEMMAQAHRLMNQASHMAHIHQSHRGGMVPPPPPHGYFPRPMMPRGRKEW